MSVNLVLAILLTCIAVSYGWGMRGAVIGGEKGAMLPGALLGFFLAKLSGIPVIEDNALIFSAIGCLGMGYGGFEPYAQNMEMILYPKSDIANKKKGYMGLMLKGANWFGICGASLGIGFSAVCGGIYKWYEIVILFALIPFVQLLGIKLFNKPFDKDKKIFPKFYFSRTSREEWGGNLLTLVIMILFSAVKGDWFAFLFGISGILSGAIGWAIAIWIYYKTITPMKNGKVFFGKLQEIGIIDNWKIMEFAFGFLGGGGLALYFFLCSNNIKINLNGIWSPLGESEKIIAIVCFALALLTVSQNFSKKLQNRFFELLERAIYFSLVLCVCMLGSTAMSQLVTFLLILWVAVEKIVFDELGNSTKEKLIKAMYLIVFAVVLIAEFVTGFGNNDLVKIIMYTYFYVITDFISVCNTPNRGSVSVKNRIKGCSTVHLWFNVLSIVLIIFVNSIR